MEKLTDKQAAIMAFIRDHVRGQGYPPTMREIGERFGFTWAAAKGHLQALERKGHIRITPNTSRGIEIVERDDDFHVDEPEALALPLVGDIRAGAPTLAVEDITEKIAVDRNLFRDPDSFVLRVKGQSMRDAGILEGDFVVVRPQQTIQNGRIGVAMVGGDEATVKIIYAEGNTVTLVPCNPDFHSTQHPADNIRIIGLVTGVIRKL